MLEVRIEGEFCWFKVEANTVVNINKLVSIRVSGDDLKFIKNFDHIPYKLNTHSQIWFGDMAKFIFANMWGHRLCRYFGSINRSKSEVRCRYNEENKNG